MSTPFVLEQDPQRLQDLLLSLSFDDKEFNYPRRFRRKPFSIVGKFSLLRSRACPKSTYSWPGAGPGGKKRRRLDSRNFLEVLPVELVLLVLEHLDCYAVAKFSLVSRRAYDLTNSLLSYQSLVKYVPRTIFALSKLALLHWHSIAALYGALIAPDCIFCGDFGPYLSPLTCDRCCYDCLLSNHGLWAIRVPLAAQCFQLDGATLAQLPAVTESCSALHPVPCPIFPIYGDPYHVWSEPPRPEARVVSLKDVKKLAVRVHGSEKRLAELLAERAQILGPEIFAQYQWLHAAPLLPDERQAAIELTPAQADARGHDAYFIACLRFPSLRPHEQLEHGRWCIGCVDTHMTFCRGALSWSEITAVPPGIEPSRYFFLMANVAWTAPDFARHVTTCPGTRRTPAYRAWLSLKASTGSGSVS